MADIKNHRKIIRAVSQELVDKASI